MAFALLTVITIWIAHAVAFFAHEYAHAILAWALGWKTNPAALHYGHLTPANLLLQQSIDENVDYAPIFASGHRLQAGMIAAGGMVVGNAFVTYPLSLGGYIAARRSGSRTWALLSYWLVVASLGNFIDYVPVRTFSPREDMHTVALGFACSPWWILLVMGLPFAVALVHFFACFELPTLRWFFPESAARQRVMVFVTAFAMFVFYGAAGSSGSGPVSHWISVTSAYCLFPLATLSGLLLTKRMSAAKRVVA